MKGAAEPMVARKLSRFSSASLSRAIATSSTFSRRPWTPMNEDAFCSWLRFHSFIAATKMAPRPGDGRSLICWYSSSSDWPDQNTRSKRFISRLTQP